MQEKYRHYQERARVWMETHADTKIAQGILAVVSFFEASILPLPPSTVLLAMVVLGKKHRWIYLALLTTVTSVLGGLFGYIIGSVLYDTLGQWIIAQYHLSDEITHIGTLFADNAFWALFVAAFTPIPYKAFTLAGGFFSINILVFIVASFIGRGLRFIIVAYFGKIFGRHVTESLFKYFAVATVLSLIIIGFFVLGGSL